LPGNKRIQTSFISPTKPGIVSVAIPTRAESKISATALYAAVITFLTYAMVYGFRKPFTVATYADVSPFLGVSYKSCLVISQVLGYMLSKFYGVRFIAELKRFGRGKMILMLVGVSWLALLLFAVIPAPYNIPILMVNGFPLGLIWGIVFSFVEGRKATDFIGAALAVSFIFSSGFIKMVTGFLQIEFAITDFWLPFVAGFVFLLPLLLFLWLLEKIPPPSESDRLLRTERKPMLKAERKAYVRRFFPGIVTLLIIYVFLTVFRDIRDNFAADMWAEMGFANQPEKFVQTEIPTTIIVLALISAMVYIRNNLNALMISHLIIGVGFLLAGIATLFFMQGMLSPFYWMMLVGLGLYMGYIPFNCVLFERMIATFRYAGNVGFLIYLADSFGYLGSVAVILTKSVLNFEISWTRFYSIGVMLLSIAGVVGSLVSAWYFHSRYQNKMHVHEK
jgi:MFS family permease